VAKIRDQKIDIGLFDLSEGVYFMF
jgi:hypothetical protein